MSPTNRYTAGREAADQPVGVGDNGIEHRLHVRRRTGDDLQYLGRRRLLLAGFLQVFARTGDRTTLSSGGRWRNAALGLGGLAALCGLALRAFASLVLPPVLDGRAISAPRVKKGILSG